MIIELDFKTGNAAFTDDPLVETVRFVRLVADKIEGGEDQGILVDFNGNRVGAWAMAEKGAPGGGA